MVGAANKRQAARYLITHLGSLRFETELRSGLESSAARTAAERAEPEQRRVIANAAKMSLDSARSGDAQLRSLC